MVKEQNIERYNCSSQRYVKKHVEAGYLHVYVGITSYKRRSVRNSTHNIEEYTTPIGSRDSAVGIATGYGLDD
jgi:hypothetical protein